MTLADLLFAALFLVAIGTLIAAAVAALRGRRRRARTALTRLAAGVALYFAAVIIVSAATPQRYRAAADGECSDDWCISVQDARRTQAGPTVQYDVAFLLRSRALRVNQRERFVTVLLRDANGHLYPARPDPAAVPFDTLLHPGEAIVARRQFAVPATDSIAGVVVARPGAGRFPGCCVIGDDESILHKRTIITLPK